MSDLPEAEQDAVMRRSYTRSSEKEILVQLRNSLNPYEKIETRIMIVQAFTAVVAVVCLLGIAIVGYTKIKDIRVSVQTVAVETTEMANLTSTMGDEMDLMVKTMEPVLLLPNITLEMEQMSTSTGQLNDVICGSPLFAPQCPPELRGALAPGMSAGSQIISDEAEADSQDKTLPEVEEEKAGSQTVTDESEADSQNKTLSGAEEEKAGSPSVTDESEANSPVPDAEEENAGSPSVTDESEADSPVPDAEEENAGSPSVTDDSEANSPVPDAEEENAGSPSVTDESEADSQNKTLSDAGDEISGNP